MKINIYRNGVRYVLHIKPIACSCGTMYRLHRRLGLEIVLGRLHIDIIIPKPPYCHTCRTNHLYGKI